MSVHIKFINLPRWHIFCIQKSYCLHKSVLQARPQNRLMLSHPIEKQYYEYYGTKSQAFYRITMAFILFYIIGFYSILVVLLLYEFVVVAARTSLSVLLFSIPYGNPVAACASLLLLFQMMLLLLLPLLLYRATVSIIVR